MAAVAGRVAADGRIEADSLVDLAPFVGERQALLASSARPVEDHEFHLRAGARRWARGASSASTAQARTASIGSSRPSTSRITIISAAEFGRTIRGFFYDEPETRGDWGTELRGVLDERKVDWKKAFVAYKFELAGDDQAAARYQYLRPLPKRGAAPCTAESPNGATGTASSRWAISWSIARCTSARECCAGDMMLLQGHSDLGAIDAVFDQFVMGKRVVRDHPTWQTPKLASSIAHTFGKADDRAMVEIFGAGPGPDLPRDEVVGRPHAGLGHQLPDPPLVQSPVALRPRLPALLLQRRLRASLAAVPRLRRLHLPAEPAH